MSDESSNIGLDPGWLKPREPLSTKEREALDARDRALMERFLARDGGGDEILTIVDRHAHRWAKREHRWLLSRWEEVRQDLLTLLVEWRVKKKLRRDEPLNFLGRRLLKQVAARFETERGRERAARSLDADEVGSRGRERFEERITHAIMAPERGRAPDVALAIREESAWLREAATKLTPADQETFDGVVAVAYEQEETLAKALGVSEAAAWKRVSRLRESFLLYAQATGATELVERLMARRHGRPAPRKPPEEKVAGHRRVEIIDWIGGRLEPAVQEELERHYPACLDCQATKRALEAQDDVMGAFLLLGPPAFDAPALLKRLEAKLRRRLQLRRLGLAAALALLVGAGLWLRGTPQPPPVAAVPPRLPPAMAVPLRPGLYSAPRRTADDLPFDGGR